MTFGDVFCRDAVFPAEANVLATAPAYGPNGNDFNGTATAGSGQIVPIDGLYVDYFRILREIARQVGTGFVYFTGTVTISSGVVTLANGTWPAWAATAAINVAGSLYNVSTRDSDTQLTLDDTSVSAAAGSSYALAQSTQDDATLTFQDYEDWISAGYREFLFPDQQGQEFETWSFLCKETTLSLTSGTANYDLPADFGQHVIRATLVSGDSSDLPRIEIVDWATIAQKQNYESASDAPEYLAWVPKTFDGSTGQRFEVQVYPTPAESYSLKVEYREEPVVLSPAAPYPRGGNIHGDTILKACKAACERDQDDEAGIHNERFLARLQASVAMEMKARGENMRNATERA